MGRPVQWSGRPRYRYDFGSELKEVYDRLTQTPHCTLATPADCRIGRGRRREREGGNLLDGRRAFFVGATAALPFLPSPLPRALLRRRRRRRVACAAPKTHHHQSHVRHSLQFLECLDCVIEEKFQQTDIEC